MHRSPAALWGTTLRVSPDACTSCPVWGTVQRYAEDCAVDLTRLLTILRKFGLERVQFEKPVESWSEGQRKKLLLARSLCQSAHLYLWDEPLNYIDLYARMQVEQLILESRPTLLFVEHDRAFCQAVSTGTVALQPPCAGGGETVY